MADTVNLFGSQVKKGYVIAGGIVVVVAIGYGYYKNKQDAAAAASTTSTTSTAAPGSADTYGTSGEMMGDSYPPDGTTGNPSDPYSTDPATGMTYGDEGAFAAGYGALSSYGDTYGYGGYYAGTAAGETAYQTNGQWAQAAEDYLVNTVGADTTTVAAAMGKYVTGQVLSADQIDIVEQAIAFVGYPPVNGTDGYPPSIRQSPPTPSTPPPSTTTTPPPTGGTTTKTATVAKPATPTGVRATPYTTYIDVGWNPVAGATSYTLHATYQETASGGAGVYPGTVHGTSGRVSGLSPGRTYTLHVAAVNSAGTSAETNGPAVKTKSK